MIPTKEAPFPYFVKPPTHKGNQRNTFRGKCRFLAVCAALKVLQVQPAPPPSSGRGRRGAPIPSRGRPETRGVGFFGVFLFGVFGVFSGCFWGVLEMFGRGVRGVWGGSGGRLLGGACPSAPFELPRAPSSSGPREAGRHDMKPRKNPFLTHGGSLRFIFCFQQVGPPKQKVLLLASLSHTQKGALKSKHNTPVV